MYQLIQRTYNTGWSNGFPTTGHFIALINRTKSTLLKSGRKNWVLFCIPSWLHVLHHCQDFLQLYKEKVSSCTNWCCFHWYNRFATLRAGQTATLALRWMWNKEPHNFGIQDLLACLEYHEGHWLFFCCCAHSPVSFYPTYIHANKHKTSFLSVVYKKIQG